MARTNAERAPAFERGGALPEREFDEMPTAEMQSGRERLREAKEEQAATDERAAEEILDDITARYKIPVEAAPDQAKINAYQERSIPPYLKNKQDREPLAARLYGMFASAEGMKEAREALPKDGPFLVVANHSGGESPVIPVRMGGEDAAVSLASDLREAGIFVGAVRPPTVPSGTSRLRLSMKRTHTAEDLARVAKAMAEWRERR